MIPSVWIAKEGAMNPIGSSVTGNVRQEELRDKCAHAASLTEEWMLVHLVQENLQNRDVPDPVLYYKWPLTLASRGRIEEAKQLLLWIRDQCLSENGDLASDRSGFHLEFHSYANLWLVLGAIRLEETELANQLLAFLHENQNDVTGGVNAMPVQEGLATEDPLSTSFMGMAACEMRDRETADLCLKYLVSLVDAQPKKDMFYLRTRKDGSLILDIEPGQDPKTYMLRIGHKEECYYFLGAMCFFLARYSMAFGVTNTVSRLVDQVTGIISRVGKDALGTIWAAKVGPGCVALYSADHDVGHLEWAAPVIEAVLAGQTEDGYWLKDGKPWVTVSAEQCYWLTFISESL